MNSLEESFRRYQEKAGQRVGHHAGQRVSRPLQSVPPQWDTQNPQETTKNDEVSQCPTPIGTGRWDSDEKSGTVRGTESGTESGTVPRSMVSARLKECQSHLSRLDPDKPLHGIPGRRWGRLVDDALWLFDGFAETAFRDGWTVGELFGLWWYELDGKPRLKDTFGGVADRLQGSRSLKMTADRAHWRRMHTDTLDQFNRTAYPDFLPMWEAL